MIMLRYLTIIILMFSGTAVSAQENIDYSDIEVLLSKCDEGNAAACRIGIERSDAIAKDLTSEQHKADGYKTLKKSQKYQLDFAIRACIRNDGYGCYRLGFSNLNGVDGLRPGDLEALKKPLEKSCRLGSPDGCAALAGTLWLSKEAEKLKRARKLSSSACAKKSINGCRIYGYLLQYGKGGQQDYILAKSISSFACDNGAASACGDLANQYAMGNGVLKNDHKAYKLYARGCELPFQIGLCNKKDDLARKLNIIESK